MASHNELGKKGEDAAVEFLQKKGHEILTRNYRYSRAEIDIISKENGIIIFSEVKTRSSNQFGFPEEFVSDKQIRLIKEAAEEFLYEHHLETEVRFDIISITINHKDEITIKHIEDAFFHTND